MKLKYLFVGLLLLLLPVWGLLLWFMFDAYRGWFYVCEGLMLVTVAYLLFFYRKVIIPLDSIASGMDLLREQDFGSRLKEVGQPEADRVVKVFNRMMEQLKEERLRAQEQNHLLDLLIAVSPMGVIMLDFDRRITMANRAALRFLNVPDEAMLYGKCFKELAAPLAAEIAALPQGKVQTFRLSDAMIYRCSSLSFMDRGFAHPFVLIESLTAEVVKAEKKAYEKVIRMIAHEVNNTVAGVTSSLDTVRDMLEMAAGAEDLREIMTVCIERSLRMSRFITNFADVVKIPEPCMERVSLNDTVMACKRFMETLCSERNITLELALCEEEVEVELDRTLFEQVLVNILKNSAESIGREGRILIRSSSVPPMLEVADSGKGISREVESKLFTPFFSTKPDGQGIGLLFTREVLHRHRCSFSLRTGEDGWTRFSIFFQGK